MNLTRRDWLRFTGGAALAAALPRSLAVAAAGDERPIIRDYEQPMFDLPGQIRDAVKIESV